MASAETTKNHASLILNTGTESEIFPTGVELRNGKSRFAVDALFPQDES